VLDYLPEADEIRVARETTSVQTARLERVVTGEQLVSYQQLVRQVPVADPVVQYAVQLARVSRPSNANAPEFVRKWIAYGASVRAAQALLLGGKARAVLAGRAHVTYDDVRSLAGPVFRHRILLNFQAQSERITTDQLIERLVREVPTPKSGM
jgi:MoxR-like ATPase